MQYPPTTARTVYNWPQRAGGPLKTRGPPLPTQPRHTSALDSDRMLLCAPSGNIGFTTARCRAGGMTPPIGDSIGAVWGRNFVDVVVCYAPLFPICQRPLSFPGGSVLGWPIHLRRFAGECALRGRDPLRSREIRCLDRRSRLKCTCSRYRIRPYVCGRARRCDEIAAASTRSFLEYAAFLG